MVSVFSWGRGEDGQLGLGDTRDRFRPVPLNGRTCERLAARRVSQVACGWRHSIALTETNELLAWGHAPVEFLLKTLFVSSNALHCAQLRPRILIPC